ncbi:MAG: ATP-binding cassette domain-containing protein [Clostridiales bacterium]|mgnify:CR=1 FL=1|nr:ATP-binding cassette domain-containing protein [Clostridiales bacterium]
MIEVKNLTKRFGDKLAVNNVSFEVSEGEVLGFLGPNGAGKSTTMNILAGYLSSNEGQALINGIDILDDPIAAKKNIGYLPEHPPLYLDMTVKAYLDFIYDLKRVKLPRKSHIAEICEVVKITDVYNRIIKNLSKGYRQRVGLAQAIIGNPKVLILDEPTVGLDPKQIIEIRSLIKRLGENHTVILSSHILPEVQAVCDKIIVINKGNVVADDTSDNLAHNLSSDHRLSVRIEGPEKEVTKLLSTIPGMVDVKGTRMVEKGIYEYVLEAHEGVDIRREMFKRLSSRNWPIMALKSSELTLEEIFLKLTMDDVYSHGVTVANKDTESNDKETISGGEK